MELIAGAGGSPSPKRPGLSLTPVEVEVEVEECRSVWPEAKWMRTSVEAKVTSLEFGWRDIAQALCNGWPIK